MQEKSLFLACIVLILTLAHTPAYWLLYAARLCLPNITHSNAPIRAEAAIPFSDAGKRGRKRAREMMHDDCRVEKCSWSPIFLISITVPIRLALSYARAALQASAVVEIYLRQSCSPGATMFSCRDEGNISHEAWVWQKAKIFSFFHDYLNFILKCNLARGMATILVSFIWRIFVFLEI